MNSNRNLFAATLVACLLPACMPCDSIDECLEDLPPATTDEPVLPDSECARILYADLNPASGLNEDRSVVIDGIGCSKSQSKAAAEITAQWNEEAGDGPITMGEWALATVRTSEAYAGLQTILASDVWATAGEQSRARAAELDREADFAARQQKAYAKMLADQEAHLDAQAAASVTYGPALPPKAEKRGGPRRKKAEAFIDPGDVAIARIGDGRDETDAIASDAAYLDRSNAAAAEAASSPSSSCQFLTTPNE